MTDETSGRPAWRTTIGPRLMVLYVCFGLWMALILGRLVFLQAFEREALQIRADDQRNRVHSVPPKRGDIVDRHGRLLAYSVDVDAVYAEPRAIEDSRATAAAVCAAIDGCSVTDREELVTRLAKAKAKKAAFTYLWPSTRRYVSPADARRITDLELKGIGLQKESRRFYPHRELAAHVLGFVLLDNIGGAGIEAAYDRRIRGREGKVFLQIDARQEAFKGVAVPPTAGATLELTIDATLQYLVESELQRGVAENRADSGVAVVMDPMTGGILALANVPAFNPNHFQGSPPGDRRNRAVQDLYEPGSTFKIVSGSAAIQEGVVRPEDPIDVSDGFIRLGNRVISDVHRYGVLPYSGVLVKSSNVGAVKVGLRTGAERVMRYVRRFGFGSRLSPDFPGENAGLVWDPARLNDSALASVAMGYQIGVTPLQMAAAVSSIANGGELIQPRVVRALIEDGRRNEVVPQRLRRTVDAATAAVLTGIMEDVVEEGTGKAARIDGYTIAGKTGTAQRLIDGQYSRTEYNASFVGFLPARRPALTIVVLVSSPRAKGYYGGTVAAPIFKRIAERAVRHLGIPPDVNPPATVLATGGAPRAAARSVFPVLAAAASPIQAPADPHVLPDLSGLSARAALRILTRMGLTAALDGHGEVVAQDPPPGTPVQPGGRCALWLGRPAAAERGGPLR